MRTFLKTGLSLLLMVGLIEVVWGSEQLNVSYTDGTGNINTTTLTADTQCFPAIQALPGPQCLSDGKGSGPDAVISFSYTDQSAITDIIMIGNTYEQISTGTWKLHQFDYNVHLASRNYSKVFQCYKGEKFSLKYVILVDSAGKQHKYCSR